MMRHQLLTGAVVAAVLIAPVAAYAGPGGGHGGYGGGGGYGGYPSWGGRGYGGYGAFGGYNNWGFYPGAGLGGYRYAGVPIYGYPGYNAGYGLGGYGLGGAGFRGVGYGGGILPPGTVPPPAALALPPSPPPVLADNTARIHVFVPAEARIWLGGEATMNLGSEREFSSPPLEPGRDYYYRVTARWVEGGKVVERSQKVKVRANETSSVTFGE